MMKHVLSNLTEADVVAEPFPHIVAKNVIDDATVRELISTFPPTEQITKGADLGSNKRFDYIVKDVREDTTVPHVWREFIEANASDDFLAKFFKLFGSHIEKRYPTVDYKNFRRGIRYIDTYETADVLVDAHISINTPVVDDPSSVRVAHVDDPRKLYAGLFYLRHPDDDSVGGDLELFRYARNDFQFYGQHVDYKYLEKINTIRYEANTLVLFLNTIDSLHGVSIREKTPHRRSFMNLVGEVEHPLFDIKSRQEGRLQQRLRRWFGPIVNRR